jgi:IS30 family transposase
LEQEEQMSYRKGQTHPSKEEIEQLYIQEGLSVRDISVALNRSPNTIVKLMREYGISARPPGVAERHKYKTKPWLVDYIRERRKNPLREQRAAISRNIRQGLRPYLTYLRSKAQCSQCGTTDSLEIHHDPPLASIIEAMLLEEHDPTYIAYELTRRHYTDEIPTIPLCTCCHSDHHRK